MVLTATGARNNCEDFSPIGAAAVLVVCLLHARTALDRRKTLLRQLWFSDVADATGACCATDIQNHVFDMLSAR